MEVGQMVPCFFFIENEHYVVTSYDDARATPSLPLFLKQEQTFLIFQEKTHCGRLEFSLRSKVLVLSRPNHSLLFLADTLESLTYPAI